MSGVTISSFFSAAAVPRTLTDSFGRTVRSVRISITDRCNFRCRYCMPEEGMAWSGRDEILSYEEIRRVVRILADCGVSRVRLTGGEPLLRQDVPALVSMLAPLPGIREIALTTNGYHLAGLAGPLARAGLTRINVSLDSLEAATFERITRRNHLDRVLEGIGEALRQGLGPVKINVVLIRGVNDAELPAFAELAREGNCIVRFIEFMPIGSGDGWSMEHVVTTGEVLERLETLGYRVLPFRENGPGEGGPAPGGTDAAAGEESPERTRPADRHRFADGKGEIGFISSVSLPFCGSCDRIRLTSDGKIRTCLFSLAETDLRGPMRGGASDDDLAAIIARAVANKEAGHSINRPGFVRPDRTMSSIGG